MNAKLGGCLLGYGLKKKDGTFKKVMFERPIHNTITKHCLNNLLTFDGTDAQPTSSNDIGNWLSLFVKSSQPSERYGVLNYCGLGNGTGETSVNDTALKNGVGTITDTKKTGNGWCGTTFDDADAIIKLRISHTHNIADNFTITEIGWFNRHYVNGTFTLSARVQLDTHIDVESGDEFYSIYELTVQFQDVERFSDFAGLGVGGYKVNAGKQVNGNYYFPLINANGIPSGVGDYLNFSQYVSTIFPPYMVYRKLSIFANAGKSGVIFGLKDVSKQKSFIGSSNPFFFTSGSYENGSIISATAEQITYKGYIQDSFYRDYETVFVFPNSSNQYYGFLCNGTFYRFGTFDENDNFTPTPININGAMRFTVRQSWSTDLLAPTP